MKLAYFMKGNENLPKHINKINIFREIDLNVKKLGECGEGFIGFNDDQEMLCYKNVPLVATIYEQVVSRAFILTPTEEGETYTILICTPVGFPEDLSMTDNLELEVSDQDMSTYGDWYTEKDVVEWLADPKPIY